MAKGRERNAKFYFKNEKQLMQELGFTPTKGSGSGWIDKEDGSNDFIITQLKSTDKQSYTIKKLDLEKLEYNANVSSKIPLFLIQFLKDGSVYALAALDDIPQLAEYVKFGKVESAVIEPLITPDNEPKKQPTKPKINSSKNGRAKFYKEKEKQWENRKRK